MSSKKVTFLKARNVGNRRFQKGESEEFDEGTANVLINGGWAKKYGDPDPSEAEPSADDKGGKAPEKKDGKGADDKGGKAPEKKDG